MNYRYADGHLLNGVVYDLGGSFIDDFSDDFAKRVNDANLRLFLNSQECYWIDERRLINKSRVLLGRESDIEQPTMVRRSDQMAKEYGKVRLVASNTNLQVIVATHSPQVFDGKWELSEDLYAQTRDRK